MVRLNVKSYKFIESVNESFFVMYQKKGVFGKPCVKYKDKKTAEKFKGFRKRWLQHYDS